jgi:thymidine phosphorylase
LLKKKIGDSVDTGETLAVFYSDGDDQKIAAAKKRFLDAYSMGPDRVDPPKLLLARVTLDGIEEL